MREVPLEKRIVEFEAWARANLGRLHRMPASEAAEELGGALLRIDEQLGVEVEEGGSANREVIVTAFSDRTRFELVRRIVAGLGEHRGWTFVALKPARGFAFTLTLGNSPVSASRLQFEPIEDISGGVRILVESSIFLPPESAATEWGWLIVETGLGEELAARIPHIEVAASRPGAGARPLTALADFVNRPPRNQ